jgi:hypothetical protein
VNGLLDTIVEADNAKLRYGATYDPTRTYEMAPVQGNLALKTATPSLASPARILQPVPVAPRAPQPTRRSAPHGQPRPTGLGASPLLRTLLICFGAFFIFQALRATLVEGNRIWTLFQQHGQLQQHQQEAMAHQKQLRATIERYQSPSGQEELVRNQLEWIAPNEVLLRVQPGH